MWSALRSASLYLLWRASHPAMTAGDKYAIMTSRHSTNDFALPWGDPSSSQRQPLSLPDDSLP
ncbi:hypothetical protein ABE215_13620 [Brevibacillus parabrevis]|uniref:hypothetical protein n=1 Tax=Brevibacillus parabrevis TaxID=54914 RepID=UPI003D192C79